MGLDLRATRKPCRHAQSGDRSERLHSRPTPRARRRTSQAARYQREITREQFEQLIQPIVDRTSARASRRSRTRASRRTDRRSRPGRRFDAHSAGAQRWWRSYSEREPHTELNPDEVVALGAAVQANILAGGRATRTCCCSTSRRCRSASKRWAAWSSKIIHRNSTIPASGDRAFHDRRGGQTNVAIHVVQGERDWRRIVARWRDSI